MWKITVLFSVSVIVATVATTVYSETIKPIKVSRSEISGLMFERRDATTDTKDGNTTTDVVTFTSCDMVFQSGMFKSGPTHELIADPPGFPYNEFLYFVSGSATFTSPDGSVLAIHSGEAVTVPKGWVGRFDTDGYTKLYVTYDPAEIKR